MILPDANLLLYAYDRSSPFHAKAASWWTDCLSGAEAVLLTAPVIFAFVRISTHPKAYLHPLTPEEASVHVRSWLERPACRFTEMIAADVERCCQLLVAAGTAGNLTTDAQLAALALRVGATVHSADSDFARFPGLKWRNPLSD